MRRPNGRPRALVVAYSCAPGRGSEPGGGWGLVRSALDFADCVVLVGPEHTDRLRRWQTENPDSNVTFIEVPEPRWAPLVRQHRVPRFLVYLAWLRSARDVAYRLHAERPFDLAFHATYSVYWLWTPAVELGIPSVWGPVGGAVATPLRLWPMLGWRGLFGELLKRVTVGLLAKLPATRRTWQKATVRLVNNDETMRRLPERLRSGTWVLNQALFADIPVAQARPRKPYLLFPSALEPRKGPRLALRGLARASEHVRLVIVTDGIERRPLEQLARRFGVADRVEFRGWIPREEMFSMLSEAAAAVFTGLHEEGGLALVEAMLHGTPVIVLANGGARTIAESSTDPARVALIEPGSVDATSQRFGAAMTHFSRRPSLDRRPMLDQAAAKRALRAAFDAALTRRTVSPAERLGHD